MIKRMAAITLIFLCITAAWLALGTAVAQRTNTQDERMRDAVGQLWGTAQRQQAPVVYHQAGKELIDASDIEVDLKLEHRQKGLLWYATYRVKFRGKYRVVNYSQEPREVFFDFSFPAQSGVYDDFRFLIGGKELPNTQVRAGKLSGSVKLAPAQAEQVEVSYESQGLDEWWYDFGPEVNQVRNFWLTMQTDFAQIDFPPSSISPTKKERSAQGWVLRWQYANLLSGVKIGMVMPRKLNPGPWVSKITFSAPVSLFLFFFLLFMFTTVRKIKIHPLNFFFIGAAFFSFHLLMAYLVDHISIHLAFLICSLVSIFLVVSYMRLVAGSRFAFLEVGGLQFVYLVLFSYTFLFEAYTGLAVTVLCIITLFIVMQFTGRIDWDKLFQKGEQPAG